MIQYQAVVLPCERIRGFSDVGFGKTTEYRVEHFRYFEDGRVEQLINGSWFQISKSEDI